MPAEGAALVVDASALAALLFGEPEGPAFAHRVQGRRLLAPTLLRHELASICVKKSQRHPGKSSNLREALHLFDGMALEEVQPPVALLPEVAAAAGLTAYDAAYLWLARAADADLLTLDRTLEAAWHSR